MNVFWRGGRLRHTERALGFLLCLSAGAFGLLVATAPAVTASWSYFGIAVATALSSFSVGCLELVACGAFTVSGDGRRSPGRAGPRRTARRARRVGRCKT